MNMKIINRTVKDIKKLDSIYNKLMSNQRLWNRYNNVAIESSVNPPMVEITDYKAGHIIRYTLR